MHNRRSHTHVSEAFKAIAPRVRVIRKCARGGKAVCARESFRIKSMPCARVCVCQRPESDGNTVSTYLSLYFAVICRRDVNLNARFAIDESLWRGTIERKVLFESSTFYVGAFVQDRSNILFFTNYSLLPSFL